MLVPLAAVPARTGSEPNQAGSRTHHCEQYLSLEGDLIEELGELLCRDTVLAGECQESRLGAAQIKPGYSTCWPHLWVRSVGKLGQLTAPTVGLRTNFGCVTGQVGS